LKRQILACGYVAIALLLLFGSDRIVSFLKPVIVQVLPGGLKVSYYAGTNFERLICKKTERSVDRNYGKQSPARDVPKDHFSAIWKGYIHIPAADIYYFKLQSDDGSRLYIDDKLIIDNWAGRAFLPIVGQKTLKKGKYSIKIEYYDKVGNARLRLKWNGAQAEIRAGSILAVPFISKH